MTASNASSARSSRRGGRRAALIAAVVAVPLAVAGLVAGAIGGADERLDAIPAIVVNNDEFVTMTKTPGTGAQLTSSLLSPILAQAVSRWASSGAEVSMLAGIDVHIEDLPGTFLGQAGDGVVWIDVDAAGWGWSTDRHTSGAGIDLFTVAAHEFGHLLGFEHTSEASGTLGDVMSQTLPIGTRRVPVNAIA